MPTSIPPNVGLPSKNLAIIPKTAAIQAKAAATLYNLKSPTRLKIKTVAIDNSGMKYKKISKYSTSILSEKDATQNSGNITHHTKQIMYERRIDFGCVIQCT